PNPKYALPITSPCSAVLGGSVYIQVMTNASGYQLRCKKTLPSGSITVFNVRREKVTIQDEFKNRTEFFINNGTLKITNVERNDSGQYSIEGRRIYLIFVMVLAYAAQLGDILCNFS
uniref:Immunoglobulin V-set domain-containing protein n=1 Tax=Amphiprion ocellaris TaxID=80972 RepID=A0AAQ5XGB8_AMPOC